MKLKVKTNGVIASCEKIYSSYTGSMTSEDFAKEYHGKVLETTLSMVGYELLSGKIDPEYEEGELRYAKPPSKFHVLVEDMGWFECFTGFED